MNATTEYCELTEIFRQDVTCRTNGTAITAEEAEEILPAADVVLNYIQHGELPYWWSESEPILAFWSSLTDRRAHSFDYEAYMGGFVARFCQVFGLDEAVTDHAWMTRIKELGISKLYWCGPMR